MKKINFNFYLKPKEVEEYLFSEEPPLWKIEQKPSNNGVMFEDRRLCKRNARIFNVIKLPDLSEFQTGNIDQIVTNASGYGGFWDAVFRIIPSNLLSSFVLLYRSQVESFVLNNYLSSCLMMMMMVTEDACQCAVQSFS